MTGHEISEAQREASSGAWLAYSSKVDFSTTPVRHVDDIRNAFKAGWLGRDSRDAEPQDVGSIVVLTYSDKRPKAVGVLSVEGWLLVTSDHTSIKSYFWRELIDGVASWELVS